LTWTSFDDGSQPPWLSVTKMPFSGPQPMPCGVRRPPAMYVTAPVLRSTRIVVPRLGAGCGLVVAPP
jgi:hypothetical protein